MERESALTRLEISTPAALPDEGGAEAALRPSRLDEFEGQAALKASLQIAIDAARGRGDPLDHILFFGPPGLGKTTLAALLAKEMGVQLRTSSGPVLEKPGDLVGLLTGLGSGDILFIDEIHRMRPQLEEFLYPAMEDFRVDVRIADGPNAQTIPMTVERFTLVGATTRFGQLTPPMRARFGIVERLSFYPAEELAQIVHRSAGILKIPIAPEGAIELARRSRGTPLTALSSAAPSPSAATRPSSARSAIPIRTLLALRTCSCAPPQARGSSRRGLRPPMAHWVTASGPPWPSRATLPSRPT